MTHTTSWPVAGTASVRHGTQRARRRRQLATWIAAIACILGLAAGPATAHAATVDAGGTQTCAIKAGEVWCWGSNYDGLGDGTTTDSATPIRVAGITDAVDISVGDGHACAAKTDGSVWCWGINWDGQLGDGTDDSSAVPVKVLALTDAVAIETGDAHSCAVRSTGTATCWGNNSRGQLGDGTTDDRRAPVPVAALTDVRTIAAGDKHTCAVRATGAVRCWGDNTSRQLGDGTAAGSQPTPNADLPGLTDAVAVGAGEEHTCALRTNGTAACWGDNSAGQLGDGTTDDRPVPTAVVGLSGAVALGAGASSTCAVTQGGQAHCWGLNDSGQLGSGSSGGRSAVPVAVAGVKDAVGVTVNALHICAAGPSNAIQCWGGGPRGELGNGKIAASAEPVAVSGLDSASSVGVANRSSCALRSDGTIVCWGSENAGQLGSGAGGGPAPAPVSVANVSGATALASGGTHHCARLGAGAERDRQVSCWGSNWAGQLGIGNTANQHTPAAVDLAPALAGGASTRVAALTAGSDHSCVLVAPDGNDYGAAWCWGRAGYGQLGHGHFDAANRPDPQEVHRDTQFKIVVSQANGPTMASGDQHTCAVSSHLGEVWCWGSNFYGQLGHGQTDGQTGHGANRNVPQRIPSLAGIKSVVAGANHTCALRTNGTVTCWGAGAFGQLGNGATPTSSGPVEVPVTEVVALQAGGDQTCATRSDGTTNCWGRRVDGRFYGGNGVVERRTPSPMAAATGASAIALGADHSCMIGSDGRVSCWGDGFFGRLGDGPMPGGHYPVQLTPSYVIGFAPPPVVVTPPATETIPPVVRAAPPARPNRPTVELRDGRITLSGLSVKRAKNAKRCPKHATVTASARVTAGSGKRKTVRTVRTRRNIKVKSVKSLCQLTATVKLTGRLAKAARVTLTISGKSLTKTTRTLRARFTTKLHGATVKLDRFVVRSVDRDVCPSRATVTIVGATKATRKHRVTKRNVAVVFAPAADCSLSITVKLPKQLRSASAVKMSVTAPGLQQVTRTVRR